MIKAIKIIPEAVFYEAVVGFPLKKIFCNNHLIKSGGLEWRYDLKTICEQDQVKMLDRVKRQQLNIESLVMANVRYANLIKVLNKV